MNQIDFNGNILELHHFTGVVTSLSSRHPICPITLRADNGKEHIINRIHLPNFSCSKGNKLKVFWLVIPKNLYMLKDEYFDNDPLIDKHILYVASKNYTTDELIILEESLGALFSWCYGGKKGGTEFFYFFILFLPMWFFVHSFKKIEWLQFLSFLSSSLTISFMSSFAICFFIASRIRRNRIKAEQFVSETIRNFFLF